MSILSEWVTQIIVFIFIGTILELIVPNNSMKRYIQIVVGLILLLILVKPILFLFSVHVPSVVNEVEQSITTPNELLESSKKQLDEQKDEIQKEQDAYIWNEVTAQLIHEADPVLQEEFDGTTIRDIAIVTADEEQGDLEQMEKLVVTLQKSPSPKEEIAIVQPVEIGETPSDSTPVETEEGKKIRQTLATIWGVEASQIEYIWEEGDT